MKLKQNKNREKNDTKASSFQRMKLMNLFAYWPGKKRDYHMKTEGRDIIIDLTDIKNIIKDY